MLSRVLLKWKSYAAGAALGLAFAPALVPGTAQAWWARGGWGWGGARVVVTPPALFVAPPAVVYAAPPPAAVVPPPPYAHWVPGHYNWRGYWIPGHWA